MSGRRISPRLPRAHSHATDVCQMPPATLAAVTRYPRPDAEALLCLAHMLFPAAAAEPRVCIRYGTGYGATWHAYTVYRLILRINTASIPDVAVLTASTVLKMLQSNHHLTEPPVRFFGADRTCS